MAVTSRQIIDFLLANPGMSDAEIVAAMEQYGVSPAQMAQAVGLPEGEVVSRVAAVVPPGQAKLLGDTWVQPNYQTIGSGEDQQVGAIESVQTYKTSGDVNSQVPVGTTIQNYSPTGEFAGTSQTTESGGASFFGGLIDAFKDPVVLAALGGAAAGGLFGGAGAAGTAGMTAAELAAYDLALGGAGGTAGATALGNALTTGAAIPTLTNLTGGSGAASGLLTTPAVASAVAPTVAGTTAATTAASTLPAATAATTAATALTPTAASVLAPAAVSALNPTVANIATSLIPTAVKSLFTPTNVGNLLQTGAQTAAGLLQQQTSKEAADKARAMIEAETLAAKQSAAFRPVGMTTRFGTSQFQIDPTTGQLTSAGYTLSPEAKNAQDRLVKLAESGLQQAEGAQAQYAPLQTGAQSLFGLGNQYLAQSPQDVAQNYLNQQMALLQPGRELELANLQNKLQQQGRGGLSVAQGGSYGATTPELQALYNARAMQEAQLAAQAQQAGQQQVAFGAGLLGQGASAMGQYYGGQQAAYAPYTTALGQVQGLETAAQQPFSMSTALAQQAAQAGSNVGQLGLGGAKLSTALATSPAATTNPYATALGGLGASPAFGQVAGGLLGGGLSGLQSMFSNTGLGASGFGSGLSYGNQDLGLFL